MSFKLREDGVLRLSDNTFIPNAPGNRDWQEYQEWLQEGNTPEPEFTPTERLQKAKRDKRREVRDEALRRIQQLYPAITDVDMIDLVRDIILSIAPAARQIANDLVTVQAILQATKGAVSDINALSTVDAVEAYDPVTDPNWP